MTSCAGRRLPPVADPASSRRAVAAVLLGGGVAACGKDGPADTLDDFLAGWRGGNLNKVGFVTADGGGIAAADVVDSAQSLAGDLAKSPLVLARQGEPKVTGDIASTADQAGLDAARRHALVVREHRADDQAQHRGLAGHLGAGHRQPRSSPPATS